MSMRYPAGFIRPGFDPLKNPDAPTGVSASGDDESASVSFTPPSNVGGAAITGYTVVSSPGGFVGTGASSPVTFSGLTNGTSYTFTVFATNSYGPSVSSAPSNSVTPTVAGQQAFTTKGTYTWVAPLAVTSVSVVAVGGGGYGGTTSGGGGGGLAYRNNITVVPGNSYTVNVGGYASPTATPSSFNDGTSTTTAGGGGYGTPTGSGLGGAPSGTYTGGGTGGNGGSGSGSITVGGGGAAGYAGDGGVGGLNTGAAGAGAGGGGGGGYGGSSGRGAGAGNVGILGQGSSGAAGTSGSPSGKGGSGGDDGQAAGNNLGLRYGGGGGGGSNFGNFGAGGAVRIIWPGDNRQFPSTNTGDL